MDRTEIYNDLYNQFEMEFFPLIAKIVAVEENYPETLNNIIVGMFDAFAQSRQAAIMNNDTLMRQCLDDALKFREEAFILCYKTLLVSIDKRIARCLKGHKPREFELLNFKVFSNYHKARKIWIKAIIKKNDRFLNYKNAYNSYFEIEQYLDVKFDDEVFCLETISKPSIKKWWEGWLFQIVIPIIIGILISIFIL